VGGSRTGCARAVRPLHPFYSACLLAWPDILPSPKVHVRTSIVAIAALLLSSAARAGEAAPQAASPAPPAPQPAKAPADPARAASIQKLLERELAPLPPVAFETPKGVRGKVEAKAKPDIKDGEEGEVLWIPIGTGQPVACTLFPERIDAGATSRRLADSLAKSLDVVQAMPVEVAEVAGNAILFTQIVYRTREEQRPLAGVLQVAVQPHQTHSFLCVHDEPGYAASFRRIVKGFAASLVSDDEDSRAGGRFAEIQAIRVGPLDVGFSERVVWAREDGGRTTFTWASQLLPRTPSEFVAIDSVEREESDAQGLLIEATHVRVQNGEVESKFTVTRGEDGKTFRYEGEKAGKKLKGTFKAEAGLATELWFARRFDAKSGFGPNAEVRHDAWSSSSNPIAATNIAYRKDAAGPRRAHLTMGRLSIAGDLDDHGLLAKSEMPIGPATIVLDRLWTRGAP
jgi:hypothetical protein